MTAIITPRVRRVIYAVRSAINARRRRAYNRRDSMATIISTDPQSQTEIRAYQVNYGNDLLPTVTVSTATATHTPPSGAPSVPTVVVSSPLVTVTLGPLSVTGNHILDVLATLSDGEKSAVRLLITVPY